jgi:acyl dehydratase
MDVHELRSSPSMKVLYPKALAGIALPFRRKSELAGQALVLRGIEVDRKRLEEYCRVCGFEPDGALPATYPHLLAFPLAMRLMTDASFPFPVMGLVHIENRIEQLRPIGVDERLDVRVHAERLRPHDRGRQFDVVAEAQVGGEAAWRSSSTYLRKGGGGEGSGSKDRDGERERPPEADATLSAPGDIGRRYGAVSGDRNPIHLHPLSARLFGLPRPIAHGMWLKAHCLARLAGSLPDAYSVAVRFKLPVPIPGELSFASDGERFAVHDAKNEKPHLSGMISGLEG